MGRGVRRLHGSRAGKDARVASADSEQARADEPPDRRADDDRRRRVVQLQPRREVPRDATLPSRFRGSSGSTGSTGPAPAPSPAPAAPAAAPAETEPLGVTVIVRDLASGRDTTFGNVGETAWQASDAGHLLAMTISAEGQTGNGVHLFDPETTVLRVLESASAGYNGLPGARTAPTSSCCDRRRDPGRDGFTHHAARVARPRLVHGTRSDSIPTAAGRARAPTSGSSRSAGRRGRTTGRWSLRASRTGPCGARRRDADEARRPTATSRRRHAVEPDEPPASTSGTGPTWT